MNTVTEATKSHPSHANGEPCFLILERDERGGLWKYMVICCVGNSYICKCGVPSQLLHPNFNSSLYIRVV